MRFAALAALLLVLPPLDAASRVTVLDDFVLRKCGYDNRAAGDVVDFDHADNGAFVYRLELEVTGDGRSEVFLALGPSGREGTTWLVYSPDRAKVYRVLGELFFHPAAFCYLEREHLLRVARRCADGAARAQDASWAATDFAFGPSGVRQVGVSECMDPSSEKLLLDCAASPRVLTASAYDAKRGAPLWTYLGAGGVAERQPEPLGTLRMAPE
jgi:hypothetical protein